VPLQSTALSAQEIHKNLTEIRCRVVQAAKNCGREEDSVKLLAVAKTFPVDAVRAAIAAGHTLFGENYVQEAKQKHAVLSQESAPFELHLIGGLQRNKAKDAVRIFDVIHSVDRIELARELALQAEKFGKTQRVLLQVNISEEESKGGVRPEGLCELLREILGLPCLNVQGLMIIGQYFEDNIDEGIRRSEFRALRELRDVSGKEVGVSLPELSMGMSHYFELAIEEGATIVRVGSAIFGARSKKQ